jgi:hypothetical protein
VDAWAGGAFERQRPVGQVYIVVTDVVMNHDIIILYIFSVIAL